jgi:hypothetical protein
MRDTLDMALEAGFHYPVPADGYMGLAYDRREGKETGGSLKAFADLVRADERNELAKHFEQAKQAGIHTDWVAAAIKASGKRRDYDRYEGDNT